METQQMIALETITTRASATDRIDACTASATPPEVRIELPSDAADMGQGVHRYMRDRIATGEASVADIATAIDLDSDELGPACGSAWASWKAIEKFFPNPECEVTFEPLIDEATGVTLTGTADLTSEVDDCGLVLDYKSGYADRVHVNQMKTYCRLLAEAKPHLNRFKATVDRTRFGEIETMEWTRDELLAWHREFCDRVAAGLEVYSPSPTTCGYCPRRYECPAKTAFVRTAIDELHDVGRGDFAEVTPEVLGVTYQTVQLLEEVCKAARAAIKTEVAACGGRIELPDGRELKIDGIEHREIDFAIGEGVIVEAVGDRWREAVSIGNGDLAKIVKELAPPRQKGKKVTELMDALDEVGAIKTDVRKTLKLQTVKKLVTEEQS